MGKYCYIVERVERERGGEGEKQKKTMSQCTESQLCDFFLMFKWFDYFNEIAVLKLGKIENIFSLWTYKKCVNNLCTMP